MLSVLDEAKPCPNCGGNSSLHPRYSMAHGDVYQTRIRCMSCGTEGPFVHGMDELGAIEKWNTMERGEVVRLHPHPLERR